MQFTATLLATRAHNDSLKTFTFSRPATFTFKSGQFILIAFEKRAKDSGDFHPFSLTSIPTDGVLETTARKLGIFTQKLHKAKPGTNFIIRGPFGLFTLNNVKGEVLLIAGGIGVTPFLSMLRNECRERLSRDITLVYSARSINDIIEKEVFDQLAEKESKFHLYYVLSQETPPGWTGATGRVDKTFLNSKFSSFKEMSVFLCGPPPMVEAVKSTLFELGLPKDKFHIDVWEYAAKINTGEVKPEKSLHHREYSNSKKIKKR